MKKCKAEEEPFLGNWLKKVIRKFWWVNWNFVPALVVREPRNNYQVVCESQKFENRWPSRLLQAYPEQFLNIQIGWTVNRPKVNSSKANINIRLLSGMTPVTSWLTITHSGFT